jgi:hypothetical protein
VIEMTPDMADANRDGLALVTAALAGDTEGPAAVLAGMTEDQAKLCAWSIARWLASTYREMFKDGAEDVMALFREAVGL